jgi:hypothetical protein
MKEHGAPSNTFDPSPPTTKPKPLPKRSARIANKAIAKNSNIPTTTNANGSDTDENKDKVILSAPSKHEKDTGHHINWKDSRVVWRDENSCRLLVKESSLIQAYKPELNRTTYSVPLIVFPDGLTTDMLPDPNG